MLPPAEQTLRENQLSQRTLLENLLSRDRRFRLHSNGDNTYTGVFHVRLLAGLHHLGVNALSNGTLFDDQAPYDSQSWILPYVVRPTELASFEP